MDGGKPFRQRPLWEGQSQGRAQSPRSCMLHARRGHVPCVHARMCAPHPAHRVSGGENVPGERSAWRSGKSPELYCGGGFYPADHGMWDAVTRGCGNSDHRVWGE